MQEIVATINDLIWSQALIYLCLGTGLFFSILTRFVQVRLFKEMIRLLFASKESARGQIYKEEDEGQFRGGPAYYLEKAMGQK